MLDLDQQRDVIVIGAGVGGLNAALHLKRRGLTVTLLEGRDRAGGRVHGLTLAGGAGLDLGPAWLWPAYQPRVRRLIDEAGLSVLPQYEAGQFVAEDQHGHVRRGRYPLRYNDAVRLQGGMVRLVEALLARLDGVDVRFGQRVSALSFVDDGVTVAIRGSQPLRAKGVVVAVPPRLTASWMISPTLPDPVVHAADRWPTWMAAHAKFMARYERPFWRDSGYSGGAVSHRGPLFEVVDHSDPERDAFALFGFLGVPAAERRAMGERELQQAVLEQLARLFGEEARDPVETWLMDWSAEPMTATPGDIGFMGSHPPYGEAPLAQAWFDNRLVFAAAETDARFGGLIEGALAAGERAAQQVIPH